MKRSALSLSGLAGIAMLAATPAMASSNASCAKPTAADLDASSRRSTRPGRRRALTR